MTYEIAVDLDGTLAFYSGWQGIDHIGEPIEKMKERVMAWIAEGKKVTIFTSRLAVNDSDEYSEIMTTIKSWLHKHGFPQLDITCEKRKSFKEIWDDRAVQVSENTGSIIKAREQVGGSHYSGLEIQPFEYCRKNRMLGAESAVVKYVTRHAMKNGAEDIKKAIHVLELILESDYGES